MRKVVVLVILIATSISCGPHRFSCGPGRRCDIQKNSNPTTAPIQKKAIT